MIHSLRKGMKSFPVTFPVDLADVRIQSGPYDVRLRKYLIQKHDH